MGFFLFDLLGFEILLEIKVLFFEFNIIKIRINFNLVFCVFFYLKMVDVLIFNI